MHSIYDEFVHHRNSKILSVKYSFITKEVIKADETDVSLIIEFN